MFLTPGEEVLVVRDGADVADALQGLTADRAAPIGQAALRRVLAEHTYDRRARMLDGLLTEALALHVRGRGMSARRMTIVVLGLSLSSSWGNGHATTYRALLRGLAGSGAGCCSWSGTCRGTPHSRDLPQPDFCELAFYHPARSCARASAHASHRRTRSSSAPTCRTGSQ